MIRATTRKPASGTNNVKSAVHAMNHNVQQHRVPRLQVILSLCPRPILGKTETDVGDLDPVSLESMQVHIAAKTVP